MSGSSSGQKRKGGFNDDQSLMGMRMKEMESELISAREELSEKEDEVEELQARERGLKEELEKIQSQYLSDARKSIQEQREFRKVVTEWTDNDREQKNTILVLRERLRTIQQISDTSYSHGISGSGDTITFPFTPMAVQPHPNNNNVSSNGANITIHPDRDMAGNSSGNQSPSPDGHPDRDSVRHGYGPKEGHGHVMGMGFVGPGAAAMGSMLQDLIARGVLNHSSHPHTRTHAHTQSHTDGSSTGSNVGGSTSRGSVLPSSSPIFAEPETEY